MRFGRRSTETVEKAGARDRPARPPLGYAVSLFVVGRRRERWPREQDKLSDTGQPGPLLMSVRLSFPLKDLPFPVREAGRAFDLHISP